MSSLIPASVLAVLGQALIASIWQGLVVGAVAALLLGFSRRPVVRYRIACLALLAMVAWPTIGLLTVAPSGQKSTAVEANQRTGVEVSTAAPLPALSSLEVSARDEVALGETGAVLLGTDASQSNTTAPLRLNHVFALVWLLGVAVGLSRLAIGIALVNKLRRSASPVSAEVTRVVRLLSERLALRAHVTVLESWRLAAPVVVGVFRPVVLLPIGLSNSLPPAQFEAVLAHELAHALRRDYLVNLLQRIAETLLFHHPVVWWLSGVVRQEREFVCDDAAVRASGGNALALAGGLAVLAKGRAASPLVSVAAAGPGVLTRVSRLLRVEEPGLGRASYALQALRPAAILVALAVFAPVLAQVGGSESPPDDRTSEIAYLPMALRYGYVVDDLGARRAYLSLGGSSNFSTFAQSGGDTVYRVLDSTGAVIQTMAGIVSRVPYAALAVDPAEVSAIEVATSAGTWTVPVTLSEPPAGFAPPRNVRLEFDSEAGGTILAWDAVPGAAIYEVFIGRPMLGSQKFRSAEPWLTFAGFEPGKYQVAVVAFTVDPAEPTALLSTNVTPYMLTSIDLPPEVAAEHGTGTLQGRLMTPMGPGGGESVVLSSVRTESPGAPSMNAASVLRSTTTDYDGYYRFEDVPAGQYFVHFPQGLRFVSDFAPSSVPGIAGVSSGRVTTLPDHQLTGIVRMIEPHGYIANVESGGTTFSWEPLEGAGAYVITLLQLTGQAPLQIVLRSETSSELVEATTWQAELLPDTGYVFSVEARSMDGRVLGVGGTVLRTDPAGGSGL
ncbi:MAG: M48 family metalloprotease [Trueperaceae bacterium]|nr:M48 family metalloprotease [Trueperaceae bacterium]